MRSRPLDSKITHLEHTVQELNVQLDDSHRNADSLIRINRAYEQRHQCESLYVQGRIYDAADSLLAIANTIAEDFRDNKSIIDWLTGEFQRRTLKESIQSQSSEFAHRCATELESIGDKASNIKKDDEAVAAYSTALLLRPSAPNTLLIKWASGMLIRGSAHEAVSAAAKVCSPSW